MIYLEIENEIIKFETDHYYFSPGKIDGGTKALLSVVEWKRNDKVLDLGCGYGVIGICAAKKTNPARITMCDISPEAVTLAKANCERNGVSEIAVLKSDGFSNLGGQMFTLILANPPFHTDFSVAKRFITEGYRHLEQGGRMMIVTKRKKWYQKKFIAVFGGVKIQEIDGYYVFFAEKRERHSTSEPRKRKMSKKLSRKYGHDT